MSQSIELFRNVEDPVEYAAAYDEVLQLWPVPHEELCIPGSFGTTHVIASGPEEAPPLVLLHPAGCGAVIWYRNVGALSRRYRTYAVDVMGEVNKSEPTRRIATREELAQWTAELFDALHIEKAHMAGNSFGGFVAANTALQLPERVGKIVLISPAETFVPMWPWYWHFMPAYLTGIPRLKLMAFDWIWQDFPADPCIAQLRQFVSLAGVPKHIAPSVLSDSELRSLRTPTLLLIGDREVIYRPETVIERATRLVPGLRAKIIPKANHNAEYTAPDEVNREVLAFLRES